MIYLVLSGYKGRSPNLIQAFKSRKNAEKAAHERRKCWEMVLIKQVEEDWNMVDYATVVLE